MTIDKVKCELIAKWLAYLAVPGIAVSIICVAYSIYAWRTSPTVPDATHTVECTEHGDRRYLTPVQNALSYRVPAISFGSAFAILIAAGLIGNGCKFNVSSRKNDSR